MVGWQLTTRPTVQHTATAHVTTATTLATHCMLPRAKGTSASFHRQAGNGRFGPELLHKTRAYLFVGERRPHKEDGYISAQPLRPLRSQSIHAGAAGVAIC